MNDVTRLDPPPAAVRQAFWLAAVACLLVLAKTVAGATLLAGFDATYQAIKPSNPFDVGDEVAASIELRLTVAVLVGTLLTVMLGLAAAAVARRADTSRTLVGALALLTGVALVLGVVFSPENAVTPDDAASLAWLETLIPAWFQTLSAVAVFGVVALFGIAFVRMGRPAAAGYYQDYDPGARWGGYGSWLELLRRGR
ncbi:hypothetical protein Daura_26020 [Dactylosporangium aurantiacum]|uniref:Uncharacterized protein n=1 Tax=Dactylosporangium aurantiacum TaxID=35754 RepID=A0A9Q9MDI5_9ACTN|nr:hypothetical protein [Dactylosporangium aurantiacum]MDG6109693.1 hypothetical protein [Dactylosporangium aurantiacum]UWZ50305.1 hypothetical protein Daura_26020 [Dactylosporangium aurantiacum]